MQCEIGSHIYHVILSDLLSARDTQLLDHFNFYCILGCGFYGVDHNFANIKLVRLLHEEISVYQGQCVMVARGDGKNRWTT